MFLSETKCDSGPDFSNYVSLYKPAIDGCGGVALLVRQPIRVDRIERLEDQSIDALFAVVTIEGRRILVCSVYIPPLRHRKLSRLFQLVKTATEELHNLACSGLWVVGDFNARHPLWHDHSQNKAGSDLISFLDDNQMTVHKPLKANTFVCTEGGSAIDLILTTHRLGRYLGEQTLDADTELFTGAPARGHLPIWTCLNLVCPKGSNNSRFNWSKVNWCHLHSTLELLAKTRIPYLVHEKDPHVIWSELRSMLDQARALSVPMKTVTVHSKPYWTDELTTLSKHLRESRKNFRYRSTFANGEQVAQAKECFNEALEVARCAFLSKQVKELETGMVNGGEFWKVFKRTFYNRRDSHAIGTLEDGDKIVPDDQEKASLFFRDIFEGGHLRQSQFDPLWRDHVENHRTLDTQAQDNSLTGTISVAEIMKAMGKVKGNKSPDNDGVHPNMIKLCGDSTQCILFLLFNAVIDSGQWPWNNADVIFIRKEGKPTYSHTSSYRPITISSHIGKLLERVLENRLRLFVVDKGILPPTQHGFRANRSTSTYLTHMIACIQHQKACKQKVAGLYLDLQKAFDSVWHTGLLYRLRECGVGEQFVCVIKDFLVNRSINLKINAFTLKNQRCTVGLPQGSVLSPLLFAVFVRDMLKDTIGLPLQFADDCTIIAWQSNETDLTDTCQYNFDTVHAWLSKWRMCANCGKTDIIQFKGALTRPIYIGPQEIKVQDRTKVLGMTVDSTLKYQKQIEIAKAVLTRKWNMIKPFIYSGLRMETSRKILLSVILPKVFHSAHIWDPGGSSISIYSMLKDIANVPFFPPAPSLHVMTGVQPPAIMRIKALLSTAVQLHNSLTPALQDYPKSKLAGSINAAVNACEKGGHNITSKPRRDVYINDRWKESFKTYIRANGSGSGLMNMMVDPWTELSKVKHLHNHSSQTLGSLVALITGHSRLQSHLYSLGLTFTPVCTCMADEETAAHFAFHCHLHDNARQATEPSMDRISSVAAFLERAHHRP